MKTKTNVEVVEKYASGYQVEGLLFRTPDGRLIEVEQSAIYLDPIKALSIPNMDVLPPLQPRNPS